jgi:hypothetical protein
MPCDNGEQLLLSRRRIELGNQLRQSFRDAPPLSSTTGIASSEETIA